MCLSKASGGKFGPTVPIYILPGLLYQDHCTIQQNHKKLAVSHLSKRSHDFFNVKLRLKRQENFLFLFFLRQFQSMYWRWLRFHLMIQFFFFSSFYVVIVVLIKHVFKKDLIKIRCLNISAFFP